MKRRKSDAALLGAHPSVCAGPSSKRPRHEHSSGLEQAGRDVDVHNATLEFAAAPGPQPLTQPDSSTGEQQSCSHASVAGTASDMAGTACNTAADAAAGTACGVGSAASAGAAKPEGVSGPITPDVPLTLPLGLAQLAMRAPAAAAAAGQHPACPQHKHSAHGPAQDVQRVQDAHHKSAAQDAAAGQPQHAQQKAPPSSTKPLGAKARRATLLMLDQNTPAGLPADATQAAMAAMDSGTQQQRQQEQQDPTSGHHGSTGRMAAHTAGASGANSLAARRKAQLLMLPADTAQMAAPVTGQQHAGLLAQQQLDPSGCRTAVPCLPSLTAPVAVQRATADPQQEQQQHRRQQQALASAAPLDAAGAALPAPSAAGPQPAAVQPQPQLQEAAVRQPDAVTVPTSPAPARQQQQQQQVHAVSAAGQTCSDDQGVTAAQQRATFTSTSSDSSSKDGCLQGQQVPADPEHNQGGVDPASVGLPSQEAAMSEDLPLLLWARRRRKAAAGAASAAAAAAATAAAAAAASNLLLSPQAAGVHLLPQAAAAAASPVSAAAGAAAMSSRQSHEQQPARESSAGAPHPQLAPCSPAEVPASHQQLSSMQLAAAPAAMGQQPSHGADQQEEGFAAVLGSPLLIALPEQDNQQQEQQAPAAEAPAADAAASKQRVSAHSARKPVSASARRRAVLLGVEPEAAVDTEAWLQQLLPVAATERQQAADGALGSVPQAQPPQQLGLAGHSRSQSRPAGSSSVTPCGPRGRRLAMLLPPIEPAAAPAPAAPLPAAVAAAAAAAAAADDDDDDDDDGSCAAEDAVQPAAAQQHAAQQQQQQPAPEDADAGSAGPLLSAQQHPSHSAAAPEGVDCMVQDPAAPLPTQEEQQQQQLEPQQLQQQHAGASAAALCAEPGCASPLPAQRQQLQQAQQQEQHEPSHHEADPTPLVHVQDGDLQSPAAEPSNCQQAQQQRLQQLSGVQSARKPVGVSARRRAALLGVAPEAAAEGQPWVEQLLSVAAAEGSLVLRKPSPANKHTGGSSINGSGGPKGAKARRLAQLLQLPADDVLPPLPVPAAVSTQGSAVAGPGSCGKSPLPSQQLPEVQEQPLAERASSDASLVVAPENLCESAAASAEAGTAAHTPLASAQPDVSAAVIGLGKLLVPDSLAGTPATAPKAAAAAAAAPTEAASRVQPALASPALPGSNATAPLAASPPAAAAAAAGGDSPSEGLLSPESFTHGQDTASDVAALVCSLLPQASNSSSGDDSSSSGGCTGAEQGSDADSGGGCGCSGPASAAAAAAGGETGAAQLSEAAAEPAVGMELDGDEQPAVQCQSTPPAAAAAAAAASPAAPAAACCTDASGPVAMDVDTPPISSSMSAGGSSSSEDARSDAAADSSDNSAGSDDAHRGGSSCDGGDAAVERDTAAAPDTLDVPADGRSASAVSGDAAAGASVPEAAAAAAAGGMCPSNGSSGPNSSPAAPQAADAVAGVTAVPVTALQVSDQSPPQQHSAVEATATGATDAGTCDASPPCAAGAGVGQQQQQQVASLPPLPPLPPMQAPQSTPVLTAQQRVCSRRQGSPSTPILQFQLGLSPSARPAGVSREGQQQQQVAQLLQLVVSYATANAGHTPGMDGPRSASAGCDTAAELDQAAATPAAAAAAVGQEESPITPDTALPLSAASRSQQRLSGLGLLQSGGSLVGAAIGGSASVQRSRPRTMLGSIAQRRAALLMSPDILAPAAAAAAAAAAGNSSSQRQGAESSSKGGAKLDAWLQFQAASAVGACHEASGDVLRDQCHAPSISPEQQQRQQQQQEGEVPDRSASMELEAALLLESGGGAACHVVQQQKGSTPSRTPTAAGRGSPHLLQQSPAIRTAGSRRSPAVQHSPSSSRHLLQSPALKPRRSPPPSAAAAAAAAAGPADGTAAGVDSSVQTTSPAGPARYIPAAALMGVSRTMVYVRLPGAKQARQAKGSRHAVASSSRSRQTAAPFGSFPLAPGELPDGAGTCPVKETLEQALRAAHLDLQLAQAAVDGAPWAACDLAGLPLGASDAQLQACKDRYEEVRGRVMRCRHPNDVAKLDKQLAAEWEWLQEVRRSTAAAASQCNKQGILRRKSLDQDALQGGWVVDRFTDDAAAAQQCSAQAQAATRPSRVTFCLPGSPGTAV